MVRNITKFKLKVKIDSSEFENVHTGYTPLPGVHPFHYFNDTTNWNDIKTPSPMDCDNVEFILVYSSNEENNEMSTTGSQHNFNITRSSCSSPKSETSTKSQLKTRQFGCITCKKAFFRRDELKRHERIHTGERPLSCDYCGKRFMRSDHRTTHMRIHTGEKPYTCHYCSNSFGRSDERLRHMRLNHAMK